MALQSKVLGEFDGGAAVLTLYWNDANMRLAKIECAINDPYGRELAADVWRSADGMIAGQVSFRTGRTSFLPFADSGDNAINLTEPIPGRLVGFEAAFTWPAQPSATTAAAPGQRRVASAEPQRLVITGIDR